RLPTHPGRRHRRAGQAGYRPAGLRVGRAGFAPAGWQTEFRDATAWSLLSDQHCLVAPGIRARKGAGSGSVAALVLRPFYGQAPTPARLGLDPALHAGPPRPVNGYFHAGFLPELSPTRWCTRKQAGGEES